MKRHIVVTFAASAAVALSGCPVGVTNPPAPDTDASCGDTACREFDDVNLEHTWAAGTYDIVVSDDSTSWNCGVTLPGGSDKSCEPAGIRVQLSDSGDAIESLGVSTDSPSVDVTISLDTAVVHEETVERTVANNRSAGCGECLVGSEVTLTF